MAFVCIGGAPVTHAKVEVISGQGVIKVLQVVCVDVCMCIVDSVCDCLSFCPRERENCIFGNVSLA